MCLVVVALAVHPRYALVIAANRDEFHARAALPAHWGLHAPFYGILAGRDLTGGGTWMGVRRDGRWALVTNVRDGHRNDPEAPSRGGLVPHVLNAPSTAAASLAELGSIAAACNGFNLFAGDSGSAIWTSNRVAASQTLTQGVHGLSNARLDTRWPKMTRTKDAVAEWATCGDDDVAPVFAALADRSRAPDGSLPATGVPLEWERLLSAPFIVSDSYGTRCSTVLTITHDGHARFLERSFDTRGTAVGDAAFEFEISRAQT